MKQHFFSLLLLAAFAWNMQAWADGVDDLPKSDSYGGTSVAASAFNLIAGADFTLEVTGTAGQEISIANGLIKYTPEVSVHVRFAQASGVVYVFEGSIYKGIVAVDASAVSFPDIFAETNDANANTGIYNTANLLQNPGFETIPNNVWLAYDASNANIVITNVTTSGTSIRAKATMEGANTLLLHGGAKYFTQSLSAGTIAPNTYYKIAYKYQVNEQGTQGGAVVRAQLGTTERASDIVTTPTHTTPTNHTNVLDVIEVIVTGSSVNINNPVWFTIERTDGTGTGSAQKLEYYDNLTLVSGTVSTGIVNGGTDVTYLSGTAYAPAAAVSTDASLSDLQAGGVSIPCFSATTYDYIYYLAPGTTAPTVTVTTSHSAASPAIVDATTVPGTATVTVTAEDGATKLEYTVNFVVNYIAGWDGNGINTTTDIPSDFGWTCSDANVTWAAASSSDNYAYRYRDNLGNGVGRVITHPANNNVFSFLVSLTGKKAYHFSCRNSNINNGSVSTLFGINTSSDAAGTMLNSQTKTSAQWTALTTFDFNFIAPEDGTYYMVWQTTSGNDRNIATDFIITLLGDALAVTFDTGGGTAITAQYFPQGESYTVIQPANPTQSGYLFKGWCTDNTLETEYDFSAAVTAATTIYAKWEDIKEGLKASITIATGLLNGGTEKGQSYLTAAIGDAQTVVNNNAATVDDVIEAYNALNAAIASYQDASLSALLVNATAFADFSPTHYNYTYLLAPDASVPTVTATASEAAEISITPTATLQGSATVTVTAGNGTTQTYAVNFAVNYLYGWNNNSGENTPNTTGWDVPSDATVSWGHENSNNSFRTSVGAPVNNGSNAMLYIVSQNTAFSYLVPVSAKKIYQLTGNIWHRNGGDASNCTYSFDLSDSREGDNIYSQADVTVTGNGAYVSYTGRLSVPETITGNVYFRLSARQNAGNWDYSGFVDLLLTELGDALVVTFNTDGGSAVASRYFLEGESCTVVQPANPTRSGYTFKGWYSDEELSAEYNFSTPVTTATTIYAKWEDINITVAPGATVDIAAYADDDRDIVFHSDDTGTGQLSGTTTTFTPRGKVKLVKTFQTNQWYPIGFPFAVDNENITIEYGMESKQGVIYNGDKGAHEFSNNGTKEAANFFVKKYNAGENYFVFDDVIAANTGYIVEFPKAEFGDAGTVEVTFISTSSPELTIGATGTNIPDGNADLSLVVNPNVSNITGIGNAMDYYQYDYNNNRFSRIGGTGNITLSKQLKPFEAIIAVKTGTDESGFRSSIGDGSSGTTALEPLHGVEEPLEVRYYTMQGIRIYSPQANGVYIVKKVYASGKTDISKAIYKNKGL
ncbi:MAG: InlB B-repeat-containing protein [Dysgonamonadaceae bacterium]|nr:InlB B-repeat-containing protein [Dysgonamonadaceae bacterium]